MCTFRLSWWGTGGWVPLVMAQACLLFIMEPLECPCNPHSVCCTWLKSTSGWLPYSMALKKSAPQAGLGRGTHLPFLYADHLATASPLSSHFTHRFTPKHFHKQTVCIQSLVISRPPQSSFYYLFCTSKILLQSLLLHFHYLIHMLQ